jgi:hypothetical protein
MKHILSFVLAAVICSNLFAQEGIQASEFFRHLSYLASDKLQGRFPGTKGNKRAAAYVAKTFKSHNLQKNGRYYYQPFDAVIKLMLNHRSFVHSDDTVKWKFNKNFSVYSFSGSGQAEAPLVLIGDSSELLANQVLVQQKWVLAYRQKLGNTSSPALTDYSLAKMAAEKGAKGIIFINQDTSDKEDVLVRLRPGSQKQLSIPVIQIKRNAWETLQQTYFEPNHAPGAVSGKPFQAFLNIAPQQVRTNNVVGIIEGNDPLLKNEYIVLGAHYDHLGWGGYGTGSRKPDTSAIHNGADDNASGTSALLTIAGELSRNKSSLKRSILLVAFGAEEEGLLGSSYFVQNLPVPKDAIKIMINMDMVGRLNTEKHLYMGGAGTFPGGVELMKEVGEGSGLNLIVHAGGVGGSDHVSFYRAGISAVGMHTGGHPEYHMPEDDATLINQQGAQQVCRYIYKVISALANRNGEYKFVPQN